MSRWYVAAAAAVVLSAAVPCRAQLVIDSLDGDVTQNEVDSFVAYVSGLAIPTSQWSATVTHNYLADGTGGQTLEGMNDLVAVLADFPDLSAERLQLLSIAIQWTDAWLAYRNDRPLGEQRVMWTGNVEPVWPPNCPTCTSSTYYESEVGDTIGHMAYTAYNILSTPAIWDETVPDGDPNGFGTTYVARAQTYLTMLEFTMDTAFTPYFIDPGTLLIRRPSTSQGYPSSFHNVNAWNVQFMLLNAYWRLGQCHAILEDDSDRTATYSAIVRNSTDMFVQNAVPITAPDGTPVYDWGYGNFGDVRNRLTGEQIGVHAQYDIWGLTRAYATGFTSATAAQMQTYADTVVHEMTLRIDPTTGAATYAGFNDRCCSTQTYNYLPNGFIFLTPYNTDIYKPAASADISSGRLRNSPGLTAGVLWAKHWVFTHPQASAPASQWVFVGPDGRLQYEADDVGNQIMDFSYAGYQGGGVAIPDVTVAQTVSPSLQAGEYRIGGTLFVRASGVVLRGEGQDPDSGTVLRATGVRPASQQSPLIVIQGSGSRQKVSGTEPGSKNIDWDRVITAIDGNQITLDAPVTTALEQQYGGGTIYKYTWDGRIERVGVRTCAASRISRAPRTRTTPGISSGSATSRTPGCAPSRRNTLRTPRST